MEQNKAPDRKNGLETAKKVGKGAMIAPRILGKIGTYLLNIILTVLLIVIVTGAIVAGAFAIYVKSYVDPSFDVENLKLNSNLTTSLYYQTADPGTGEVVWEEMEKDRLSGSENRIWVSYDQIPQDMFDAIVSIEDKRFYSHNGVDIRRTGGAVLGFLTGNDSYGGSTITQQLIKQVTGDNDVTIQRKIQEMLRALDLESKRDKKQILEMYLNTIYLSHGCYGVQTAANTYFGKDISECTLVECAALAAIPQAPTKWDPILNPENNEKRRNDIIHEMYEQGYITQAERDEAWNTELVIAESAKEDRTETVHSYYVDTVIDDLVADLQTELGVSKAVANQMVFSGGLKIYTAIDMELQTILEESFCDDSIFPKVSSGVQPEAAMCIMNQQNGNVVAIVGGRGVKTTPRGLNRATQSKRQPGSSIKPLSAYSLALDQGIISYASPVDDAPFALENSSAIWPANYPAGYNGLVPAYYAVQVSKNTCAVQVVNKLSTRYVYDYLTKNYHLSTLVDNVTTASGTVLSDVDLAPLALGGMTYGVTVRDMTAAYCTFGARGVYHAPRTYLKVLDSEGNIILSKDDNATVLLKESTASIMTKMLQDVVKSGTAADASITLDNYMDLAAKTGTTTETKDLYFVGFTPYYTAACWCGYDQPKTLRFNSNACKVIWNSVMLKVHGKYIERKNAGETLESFPMSNRVVTVTICRDSGLLPGSYCNLDLRGSRTIQSYFDKDNVPTRTCDCHVPVRYCTDSNCVAGPGCPNVKIVALVYNKRVYKRQVTIADAQYTFVEIPDDYVYPADTTQPFYINAYPAGTYAGTSGVARPANSFCVEHNYALTDAVQTASREKQGGSA